MVGASEQQHRRIRQRRAIQIDRDDPERSDNGVRALASILGNAPTSFRAAIVAISLYLTYLVGDGIAKDVKGMRQEHAVMSEYLRAICLNAAGDLEPAQRRCMVNHADR